MIIVYWRCKLCRRNDVAKVESDSINICIWRALSSFLVPNWSRHGCSDENVGIVLFSPGLANSNGIYYFLLEIFTKITIIPLCVILIIIICRNRHRLRGWMLRKRETHMVCNLHFPTGTTYFKFFRIWNRRSFHVRKPYQFPGWMKHSPYYCPGRGASPRPPRTPRLPNKQGVPHPTRSAIGRRFGHREAVRP